VPVVHWCIDSLNKEFFTVHALIPLVSCFIPSLFANVFTVNLFKKITLLIRTYFVIGHSRTRHNFYYVLKVFIIYYNVEHYRKFQAWKLERGTTVSPQCKSSDNYDAFLPILD